MDTRIRGIDPVTFEILSHRLHQVTREMGITLERTGGTVNTTQQRDYMASLYRPDGDILSAGATLGQHVVCASYAVKRIIERFPPDEIFEHDVFLLNDPYLAAIHQSDIYVIAPIHHRERLVAWSATFVHVNDVGAMSPGGDSPDATEIFHEGSAGSGYQAGGTRRAAPGRVRHPDQHDPPAGHGGAGPQVRDRRQQRGQDEAGGDVRTVRPGTAGVGGQRNDPLHRSDPPGADRVVRGRRVDRGAGAGGAGYLAHEGRAAQARGPAGLRLHRHRPAGGKGGQPAVPRHLRVLLRRGAHHPGLRSAEEPWGAPAAGGHRAGGDAGERHLSRTGVVEHHLLRFQRRVPGQLRADADAGHPRALEGRDRHAQRQPPERQTLGGEPVRPLLLCSTSPTAPWTATAPALTPTASTPAATT